MSKINGNHYICGKWIDDAPNGVTDSLNPATGEVVGQAPNGSKALAVQAITAAREAFESTNWSSDPRLRAKVLLEFADRIAARKGEIARLMAVENGKIISQALHEVEAGVSEARYYAGLARNIFGRTLETGPGKMSLLTREASGVVSVYVPWNAPVTLLVRSVAPALAAGCTVVIKPAPQTPLTNAAVIACFDEISTLPKGVINSINDFDIEVGEELSTNIEVDVVSFTGSSKVGKIIMSNAANTIKRLSLELGGKSPALVFADADIDKAVAEIKRGSITLNGQMCTAINRVLIQASIYDVVVSRLKNAYERTKIANPLSAGVELGPLVDRANQQRILEVIERASDEYDIVLKGGAPEGNLASGSFVTPSIFKVDNASSWLPQEELFGPILSVERFEGEPEAIAAANATRYGLAASVYTRNIDLSMRVSRKLKFGTVWLNCHNRLFAEGETGGYRESGTGRLHGVEALDNFLETKHVYFETNA